MGEKKGPKPEIDKKLVEEAKDYLDKLKTPQTIADIGQDFPMDLPDEAHFKDIEDLLRKNGAIKKPDLPN